MGKEKQELPNYYLIIENRFNELKNDSAQNETDDSDDEEQIVNQPGLTTFSPRLTESNAMTVITSYHGKAIRFKGNQLIVWARDMMGEIIATPLRKGMIDNALRGHQAIIKTPKDWLNYEGMLDSFKGMPAKPSTPFYGTLFIHLNENDCTTVLFKNKIGKKKVGNQWIPVPTDMLYAHLSDKRVIDFLIGLGLKKYYYEANYGLSYPDLVAIINLIKTTQNLDDSWISERQLSIFSGTIDAPTVSDYFLAYFNAVLFGSETSRNSLSFITSIITLKMISKGKLAYSQAFDTSLGSFTAYPMASPGTGPGNMVIYNELIHYTQEEGMATNNLSSDIGMESSRRRANWTQVHLKEAVLLKFWADDINPNPQWLNAEIEGIGGEAVEFVRQFKQRIAILIRSYCPENEKCYVYSQDELRSLSFWEDHSRKIWKEPDNPQSTSTYTNALKFYVTSATPLRIEKDLEDAIGNVINELDSETYKYMQ